MVWRIEIGNDNNSHLKPNNFDVNKKAPGVLYRYYCTEDANLAIRAVCRILKIYDNLVLFYNKSTSDLTPKKNFPKKINY